jgi:hypothetical protein
MGIARSELGYRAGRRQRRSLGGDRLFDIVDIRTRMETSQRMHVRQSMYDRQARVIGKHNG